MQKYIGTKIISAEPQQAPRDMGSHKAGEEGYRVVYEDGYESWSPKAVFEAAYRKLQGLTIGQAVEALKAGKRVARAGWNGNGMWLALVEPLHAPYVKKEKGLEYCISVGTLPPQPFPGECLPYVGMHTAEGEFVPWLASQSDALAEDWLIVE